MISAFDSPTGSRRDTKELEYLSALLQTNQQHLRADGTIKACDVVLYLRSRHGIVVSEDVVKNLILKDLAGQTTNSESDVLDLCQLTAILIIPELIEATGDETLLKKTIETVFSEVASELSNGALTKNRLREIFDRYDDFAVSDDLLEEMIATRPTGDFALIDALTSDLAKFRLEWKSCLTTNYADASQSAAEVATQSKFEIEDGPIAAKEVPSKSFTRVLMFGFIDYSSDGFRRPIFVMVLWTCFVATYFAYVFNTGQVGECSATPCSDG